jgi:biopolymer transport protein TolQ
MNLLARAFQKSASPAPSPAQYRPTRLRAGRSSRSGTLGAAILLLALLAVGYVFAQSDAPTAAAPAAGTTTTAPGFDIMEMVRHMDFVGGVCLGFTILFSIGSWAVILFKGIHFQIAGRQTSKFVKECMSGTGSLEEAYRNTGSYPDSPLAQILREGYLELELEDWYKTGYNLTPSQRIDVAKAGLERVFERTITNEVSQLESYLILLAVTSNVCPFFGLFGTVWGIMVTFQAIGHSESAAALSSLAPGIATALVVTVAGLAAAIPASIMYNYFTARVQLFTSRMDSFALELANVFQKQLMKQNVGQ